MASEAFLAQTRLKTSIQPPQVPLNGISGCVAGRSITAADERRTADATAGHRCNGATGRKEASGGRGGSEGMSYRQDWGSARDKRA